MKNRSAKLEGRPPAFTYDAGVLHCEGMPVPRLAARFGTPLYVYSAATIRERYSAFDAVFADVPHTVCYSVKANSNLSILKMLAAQGCGFDVVSAGELERVRMAERRATARVVFSGVGKTPAEMDAALRAGILLFNIESASELRILADRSARLKKTARVALRVNPDVCADTHPYIATGLHKHKFGVPIGEAPALYRQAARLKRLDVAGVSVHIGSQITSSGPFGEAMQRVAALVVQLRRDGHDIRYVDAGGGLGIRYEHALPDFSERVACYAQAVAEPLRGLDLHLLLEPGRAIVGPAGALITRVLYTKQNDSKRFLVVDAAMNDLIRPSLYGAYHEIVPVEFADGPNRPSKVDVVGPICETGDFFARDRELPQVGEDDLLAILDAGAYGMSLSSNYNSRPRLAEVLVDGRQVSLIRRRETFKDLVRTEI